MSRLVAVKWFIGAGRLFVDTEMRDWQQPHAATMVFLKEQYDDGVAAGALLSVFDQDGLDLTLVKTHVLFNGIGKKSAALKKTIEKELAAIQARALKDGAARGTKKKRGATPTRRLVGTKKPLAKKKPATRKDLRAELDAIKKRKAASAGKPARRSISGILAHIEKRPAMKPCNPMFMQGMQLFLTNGVQGSVRPHVVKAALTRFASCDWGDVDATDTRANNAATRAMRGEAVGVYRYPDSPTLNVAANLYERTVIVHLPSER